MEGEVESFMAEADKSARLEPLRDGDGFVDEQARSEAGRCLHCDCRKADDCKLREFSEDYEAKQSRYKGERGLFRQEVGHPEIIYEEGKCIKCGLCIQIAAEAKEELGLTFIGRGFDVRVGVPFGRSIAEGLKRVAEQCVKGCPTGALAVKKEDEGMEN